MSQRAREWQVDGAAEIVNDLIKILDDYDMVQVTAIEESI